MKITQPHQSSTDLFSVLQILNETLFGEPSSWKGRPQRSLNVTTSFYRPQTLHFKFGVLRNL